LVTLVNKWKRAKDVTALAKAWKTSLFYLLVNSILKFVKCGL